MESSGAPLHAAVVRRAQQNRLVPAALSDQGTVAALLGAVGCAVASALARVDEMTRAFEGATKIKSTPIPMSLEHCCAVLANLYVYSAPIALASDFISQNESAGTPRLGFREVTLRTMFASF